MEYCSDRCTDTDVKVETYFLHSPDKETSIEETADAVQELYKTGRFKRVRIGQPLLK